jgi:FkbM family methyltransferase
MPNGLQKIRSLWKLLTAVRNPIPPLFDRLGLSTRPYKATLRDGTVFELRPGRGDWPSVNSVCLWKEYSPVGRPLSPGDKVLDIGANIGAFAVHAARAVGPTGLVIAVEPASDTFRQLERNLALNDLTNVVAKRAAAGETPGTANLHVTFNSVFSSFYEEIASQTAGDRIEQVTVVTLDQLLEEHGWDRCHFLKLDCEGAEHGIVNGLSAATAAKIDQIAMETHHVEGYDTAALVDKLKRFGFSVQGRGSTLRFWREG